MSPQDLTAWIDGALIESWKQHAERYGGFSGPWTDWPKRLERRLSLLIDNLLARALLHLDQGWSCSLICEGGAPVALRLTDGLKSQSIRLTIDRQELTLGDHQFSLENERAGDAISWGLATQVVAFFSLGSPHHRHEMLEGDPPDEALFGNVAA